MAPCHRGRNCRAMDFVVAAQAGVAARRVVCRPGIVQHCRLLSPVPPVIKNSRPPEQGVFDTLSLLVRILPAPNEPRITGAEQVPEQDAEQAITGREQAHPPSNIDNEKQRATMARAQPWPGKPGADWRGVESGWEMRGGDNQPASLFPRRRPVPRVIGSGFFGGCQPGGGVMRCWLVPRPMLPGC